MNLHRSRHPTAPGVVATRVATLLRKVRGLTRRDDGMVAVSLSVNHDDGSRTRHLGVRLELPAVPRVGERIRAGDAGSYFVIQKILWDERKAMVIIDAVNEHEHRLADLQRRGWRVLSEWSSAGPSGPGRRPAHLAR